MKSNPSRNHSRTRRGAAAVEFAFVLPVLVLLSVLITDVGHVGYTTYGLSNAARSAAIYAGSHKRTAVNAVTWQGWIESYARGEMAGMAGYNDANLTVEITPAPTTTMTATEYTVTLRYQYTPIISYMGTTKSMQIVKSNTFLAYR